jgi:septum formation protein
MAILDGATLRPALVLASSSRYRQELLERLRIPFAVDSPEIDETPGAESPLATAVRLAREKATAVAARHPGALVIGSDQVATVDGLSIGKPGSHARALEQLKLLRGRAVLFHTAICLVDTRTDPICDAGAIQRDVATVTARFRDLTDGEIDAYLRIEQPYDCAGSAKAEGLGIALLESIESDDPTALIGLPLIRLVTMLRNRGYPLFGARPENS